MVRNVLLLRVHYFSNPMRRINVTFVSCSILIIELRRLETVRSRARIRQVRSCERAKPRRRRRVYRGKCDKSTEWTQFWSVMTTMVAAVVMMTRKRRENDGKALWRCYAVADFDSWTLEAFDRQAKGRAWRGGKKEKAQATPFELGETKIDTVIRFESFSIVILW